MQMFSFQMNTLHKGIFHLLLRLTLIVPAFRAELFAGESNLGERWVGGDIVSKAQVHRIVSNFSLDHSLARDCDSTIKKAGESLERESTSQKCLLSL